MKAFHSGTEFRANGIHLSIQFRSFVLNPQHFINQVYHGIFLGLKCSELGCCVLSHAHP